jgi:DNA-binding SARP family transcriptional activator
MTNDTSNHHPLLQVFGLVTVEGAVKPLVRAFALDLVTYLVLHPGGVSTDRWSTAMWPDRLMAEATVHSTSSAARRCLGRDPSGRDYLPFGHARLSISPAVRCDLDLVEAAPRQGVDACRAALAALRGRPFDGLRRYEWVLAEGHLARAERAAASLVTVVALDDLDRGHPEAAQAALRRGLAASPFDEALWRLLFEATYATGSAAGLDAVLAELGATLGAPALARHLPDLERVEALVHPTTWARYLDLRVAKRA